MLRFDLEGMEHRKTNEKIAEREQKVESPKGKDLSLRWRDPTTKKPRLYWRQFGPKIFQKGEAAVPTQLQIDYMQYNTITTQKQQMATNFIRCEQQALTNRHAFTAVVFSLYLFIDFSLLHTFFFLNIYLQERILILDRVGNCQSGKSHF